MARAEVHSALGTLDENGNFVPAVVPREEIEAARADALKAIAAHRHRAFNDLRPGEVEASSASYLEPFVRAHLEKLEAADPLDVEQIEETRMELSRLLVNQGRFSEAAEVHEHGRTHAAAAHRPDDEWCDCGPAVADEGDPQTRRALRYHRTEIVSEVHGGVVWRWSCTCCGHMNIGSEIPDADSWFYTRLGFHGSANHTDAILLKP